MSERAVPAAAASGAAAAEAPNGEGKGEGKGEGDEKEPPLRVALGKSLRVWAHRAPHVLESLGLERHVNALAASRVGDPRVPIEELARLVSEASKTVYTLGALCESWRVENAANTDFRAIVATAHRKRHLARRKHFRSLGQKAGETTLSDLELPDRLCVYPRSAAFGAHRLLALG